MGADQAPDSQFRAEIPAAAAGESSAQESLICDAPALFTSHAAQSALWVFHLMRLLSFILLLLVAIPFAAEGAPAPAPAAPSAQPSVAVIFALKSRREYHVPWTNGLTLDAAISAAARKRGAQWREAWRYRASFWTRNFRDPHSFWARALAGEKATGYTYFANAGETPKSAVLKPGDRIYVDLSPIL